MKPYFKELIKESTPSLIVFISAASQDAVEVKYLTEELKAKYADKANIQRVDVSFNHKIADEYRISEYPTWVLFKEGEELMRESGRKTVTELSELIDRAF
ncbi:MAG: thioredoxin family protein [Bacteroidales bacterium]|nr:thioredoxin family protein [Bacteroidales bacterium]